MRPQNGTFCKSCSFRSDRAGKFFYPKLPRFGAIIKEVRKIDAFYDKNGLARETKYLRYLATSPMAEELVEQFNVPEVEEAEQLFKSALQEIGDLETRNNLDMAAGKISRAYQILGFCAGYSLQGIRTADFQLHLQ